MDFVGETPDFSHVFFSFLIAVFLDAGCDNHNDPAENDQKNLNVNVENEESCVSGSVETEIDGV